MPSRLTHSLLLAFVLLNASSARGEAVTAATASNFRSTLELLLAERNDSLKATFGSTGKLTAQIIKGAPFDVFLSADDIADSLGEKAVSNTEFTYAIGQLALVSRSKSESSLEKPQNIDCIAIANPEVAPYGRAAVETIDRLIKEGWSFDRIVKGQSVAQAFQFVDSGACAWGLVAYAQVLSSKNAIAHIVIPQHYHQAIKQNAVLLKRAEKNAEAIRFLVFLKSEEARKIIVKSGYLLEQNNNAF